LKQAIILFAHGSRDPEWARPFERIAASLSRRLAGVAVQPAYLELIRPSLEEALASLLAQGAGTVHVIPFFLGQGGHVKQDLPRLIASARTAYPATIELEPAIGEQARVTEAIAEALAASFTSRQTPAGRASP
jgi:sirohydrochlorin cobaltochelatase